ncbi:DUF4440 domain-containing protein [Alsobacter soli]|uniref:DUF4440 domain-containing protein n=1 Tax=Alsobacter soli TaxID=2109933 RepID=A0A2T1HWJ2_9HYPH|nr:nuclear transport factor 2 family protein [Alsobacter soli]PSC06063.1 DUF4440 domain-containing protein [Alsobacter soli]
MRSMIVAALLSTSLIATSASAGVPGEVLATYEAFAAAQNARDLARVRELLLDSPDFLWVSDGIPVWGPDATLARMALFQQSEIWRVEPALERARVVEIGPGSAFLALPLVLRIGSSAPGPDALRFLVNVLCVHRPEGWRIAALFTTPDKTAP